MKNRPASTMSFTARERALIRQEMCQHFGEYPRLADGVFLRTWRSGPLKSQPKIPPAIQSMLDRRLVEIQNTARGPRAFFTDAGMAELRVLVADARYMDPARFPQLRYELGLEPARPEEEDRPRSIGQT
jgi:hypothetical protein